MNTPTSFNNRFNSPRVEPLVRLWLLRLLVPMGMAQECLEERRSYRSADRDYVNALAEIFDAGDQWFCKAKDVISPKNTINSLRRIYNNEAKNLSKAKVPGLLAKNVVRLSKLVGLSRTDCRILEFAVFLHTDEMLRETTDMLGSLSSTKLCRALAMILDLPEADIHKSLGNKGVLTRSGLVPRIKEWRDHDELKDRLALISSGFSDAMLCKDADPSTLLRDIVSLSAPAHLGLDDFSHKASEIDVLAPYLGQSLMTGRQGVNILIYGVPGTGKTQLARILAGETGCKLFEVASEDEDGDPLNDRGRLRCFHLAQALLSGQKLLILFDEIEDVFHSGADYQFDAEIGYGETKRNPKAWFNRQLEENRTPTLWIANSIHGIHPAFMRRFDMVVEMPVPPRRQREKIIRTCCSDLLSERDIERISSAERLVPAVVTRASSVVETIGDELAQTDQAATLELIINNTLEAQGHRRIKRYDPNQLPETYNPEFIHADADVESIAAGLKETRAGRLCLYGPSGTGKTAYGRWLAEQLEVPLLVKRGSDLISMWVGETEKNIAECFRQAEMEGAILLIDEIEGFLQDRRMAKHSWEVTGVNEMLTQMESFPGVFIASTNLVDYLDQASLRRFDLKIEFDFLLPQQSQALLESYCHTLNLDAPDNGLAARLSRLHNLTPGDFAAVMRRHRFKPVCSAAEIMTALEEECSLKENFKRPIGFC